MKDNDTVQGEKLQWVKKPIPIDAFFIEKDNLKDLEKWVQSFGDSYGDHFKFIDQGADGASLICLTLEGTSYNVSPKDVIIRGIKGEYYPCKKDIFKESYSPVNQELKGDNRGEKLKLKK